MIELRHYYSLTPEWQYEPAKRMRAKLIDDKITIIPKKLGYGESYFTQVIPGVSVVLLDVVFTTQVMLNRLKSSHDFYILQYDLSDEVNQIIINDEDNHSQHTINSDCFAILNNHVQNYFKPIVGKRIFALRLLVDKKLLNKYIKEENKNINIKDIGRSLLFYKNVDSKSKILIHSLMDKSVFDTDFNPYIKGISLKLLANFVNGYTLPTINEIHKIEKENINKAKDYLLDNLYEKFPSIVFLSKIAGMSTTKFKALFAKMYNTTPKQFFTEKKIILAKELLSSRKFSSPTDVIKSLGYAKTEYFHNKYFEYFGRKPFEDFLKDNN